MQKNRKLNIRNILLSLRGLSRPLITLKSLKQLKEIRGKGNNDIQSLEHNDSNIWAQAFKKLLKIYPEKIELVESFYDSKIQLVKESENDETTGPIIICVVKDDLERTKLIYKHHSDIGIDHFVFIDNNSEDGTLEWLKKQQNVDLYSTTEEFTSNKKYGWINKILSIYGYNQWYLYVDSDEMFVYPNYENRSIQDYIAQLESNQETRVASLMVDMYSNDYVFNARDHYNILEDYRYFDTNSYYIEKSLKGINVKGGPRLRIIKDKENTAPLLIKHPLFYFTRGEIFESAHYLFPYQFDLTLKSALLHYKFLPTDLEKYKVRAEKGNFSEGSREYKMYVKNLTERKTKFIYEESMKYNNSNSLKTIDILDFE